MKRTVEFAEHVGLSVSLVLWIAWVVSGAAAACYSGNFLAPHPLGIAAASLIAGITGMGGLIGYWVIADLVDFRRLGYRVKSVVGNEWLYEERESRGSVRSFSFTCDILGDGYPAPRQVQILGDAMWVEVVPVWAHGRRGEIMERIAHCFGADAGGRVQFVELTRMDHIYPSK